MRIFRLTRETPAEYVSSWFNSRSRAIRKVRRPKAGFSNIARYRQGTHPARGSKNKARERHERPEPRHRISRSEDRHVEHGGRVLRAGCSEADRPCAHTDNIKADRTPEDLLFQVLVDWGVDLSLPIAQETVAGKKVFFVDGNALAACFDPKVSEDLVKELAKRKPLRAVFRDSSYDSDSVKINVEQIFKLLSPETEVKSL